MKQYTLNNHFIQGFNNVPFNNRIFSSDRYFASYGRASKEMSLSDAIDEAADQVINSVDKEIYLCFSGGIDSEVMVQTFLKKNYPFKIALFRFSNGENDHDIKYAKEFCQKNDIEDRVLVYQLNFHDWFNSTECKHVLDTSGSTNVTQLYLCWLIQSINNVNAFPVIANGDPYINRSVPADLKIRPYTFTTYNEQVQDSWYLTASEDIVGTTFRFANNNDLDLYPYFFTQTPNVFRAFFKDPYITNMISTPDKYFYDYIDRFKMYSQYYSLQPRPRYHGTENLENNDKYKEIIKGIHPNHSSKYRIKYADLLALTAPEGSGHISV